MNSPNKKVIGFAGLAARVQALPDEVWLRESAAEPEENTPTPTQTVRPANNKLRRFDDGAYAPEWWNFKITPFKVLMFLFVFMLLFGIFSKN